jgi:urocanate hydratase
LAFETISPAALKFTKQVEEAYRELIESALADREIGLGGKLFYAGELDERGRALVAAANIAGAATLVVTADRDAQKQAIRDGIADFLVNSLDEGLRILKNELRKRGTVAVCVGLAPGAVECEIRERGVLPDLKRADVQAVKTSVADAIEEDEQTEIDPTETKAIVAWTVASAPAQWLPRLDAIALDCLDADEWQGRRWLRVAPRFLGRLAHGMHLISADREFAARYVEQVRSRVQSGEIAVGVEIRARSLGIDYTHRFAPRVTESES